MKQTELVLKAAAIFGVAVVLGVWAGQTGQLRLPGVPAPTKGVVEAVTKPAPTGPVVYYRDPDGRLIYSETPKSTPDGRPYIGVRASDDVSFEKTNVVADPATSSSAKIKFYRNPMGLPDTSPNPKKDSMGMDYIPVFEGETEDGNTIKVSPGKVQRAGVETVIVRRQSSTRAIKASGVVQLDERRATIVAPRFDGYVVGVAPVTNGSHVKLGDPLVTVFGPELINQGAELIVEQALAGPSEDNRRLKQIGRLDPSAAIGPRRRLLNLGLTEDFIDQIKRDRRVPDTFTFRAPRDGVVLERNVVEGQAFKAGDVAFRIADHSVVWVHADVPEGDLTTLKAGQAVLVTTRTHPGRSFPGTVALVFPHLIKETRTARVRIELLNSDLALLPDMYTDVEIKTGGGELVLVVPTGALIDSGNRQVVLLSLGEGRYEPRDVKAGRIGDGMVEVMSGLTEGDRIVANGLFLIDSESNLQAALKGFTSPSTTDGNP